MKEIAKFSRYLLPVEGARLARRRASWKKGARQSSRCRCRGKVAVSLAGAGCPRLPVDNDTYNDMTGDLPTWVSECCTVQTAWKVVGSERFELLTYGLRGEFWVDKSQ